MFDDVAAIELDEPASVARHRAKIARESARKAARGRGANYASRGAGSRGRGKRGGGRQNFDEWDERAASRYGVLGSFADDALAMDEGLSERMSDRLVAGRDDGYDDDDHDDDHDGGGERGASDGEDDPMEHWIQCLDLVDLIESESAELDELSADVEHEFLGKRRAKRAYMQRAFEPVRQERYARREERHAKRRAELEANPPPVDVHSNAHTGNLVTPELVSTLSQRYDPSMPYFEELEEMARAVAFNPHFTRSEQFAMIDTAAQSLAEVYVQAQTSPHPLHDEYLIEQEKLRLQQIELRRRPQ
jgi:hypothetical protein